MKIMQVSFDTSIITVIIDDDDSLIDILKEEDDSFKEIGNKICYEYGTDYNEECVVNDVTNKRGIIQFESH